MNVLVLLKTQADAQQIQNDIPLSGKVGAAGSAAAVGAQQWQQDLLKYDSDKLDYNIKNNKFDVEKLHNQLDSEVQKTVEKSGKVPFCLRKYSLPSVV